MYNHILAPIHLNSNPNTDKALSVAKLMAGSEGTITLLHVIERVPTYASTYISESLMAESHKAIAKDLAKIADTLPNATSVVIKGHSGRSILEWAAGHDIDCIVVASHKPVASDYLIGSTAAHIVRHAACAVHVVR